MREVQRNRTNCELRTTYLSAQGSLVHGTFGRALLAGGAALQPDERAAEPHRGQNVFAAPRPSTASTPHAPTGRDQATLCDQVGQETVIRPLRKPLVTLYGFALQL